jgi:hypothetical protein
MTERTKDRWPAADVLVEYLRDYAKVQEADGKTQYNTTVRGIRRECKW